MTKKKLILVTGANGQLGRCLQDISTQFPSVEFAFRTRSELPIDHISSMRNSIFALRPYAIINAAAYTAVDKAESEQELAHLMNAEAPAQMAAICKSLGARFVHVSTDYVFNGEGTRPYLESDPVDPVNAYGASKEKGEALIMQANANSVIVRTSWVYCKHGNNFVKTMLRVMKERESVNVVEDQVGCPTYAIDLAEALMTIALQEETNPGIYHFSNSGPISWHQFAVAIKELAGLSCQVNAIPTTAYPTPAKRPHYSVMSNEKITQTFGIGQKDWKARLKDCLHLLA